MTHPTEDLADRLAQQAIATADEQIMRVVTAVVDGAKVLAVELAKIENNPALVTSIKARYMRGGVGTLTNDSRSTYTSLGVDRR